MFILLMIILTTMTCLRDIEIGVGDAHALLARPCLSKTHWRPRHAGHLQAMDFNDSPLLQLPHVRPGSGGSSNPECA